MYDSVMAIRRLAIALLACAAAIRGFGQSPDSPKPKGTWQTPGEIQQPKGTWQTPGEIQKPGEIQTVKERCTERLRVGSDALFEFNQSTLTPAAEKTLAGLDPLVKAAGKHPITIEGHTDSVGTDAYNQVLSEKRAEAVRKWLADHGVVSLAATIKGYGRTKPIAPNKKPDGSDNPAGRAVNRRVEIVIDTCR